MKRFVCRALIALVSLSLAGMGCNRTVDNTDDDINNQADIVAGDDSTTPDDDATVDPEDSTTVPGKDITIPEGCGTVGLTVSDMQTRDEGLNCEQPAEGENGFINLDQGAELNCLIATSQVHSATDTLDAFYAADVGGGEYSGVKIVMAKGTAPEVAIGDVVSMVGDLKEYYCLTEFEPMDVQVFANNGAPFATPVTAVDLNADPEKWEGVLVKFEGVKIESIDTYGGFTIEGGVIVADMIFEDMAPLEEGCEYTSLTGVIEFGYGKYKLLPRNAGDLVAAPGDCEVVQPSTTTIADIQDSETSSTCNDEAFVDGGSVSLAGLIVATPRYTISKDKLHGFFVTTPDGSGPFSGIVVTTEWSDDVDLAVGTEINLEADWTEYYCLSELSANKITETGENKADSLKVTPVEASDIGEDFEGVIVELSGTFKVEEAVNQYGEVMLSDGIIIKMKFDGVDWDPALDTTITGVVGPVDYGFGKYMIMPVTIGDIKE
jgi:hypothetical protein